MAQVYENDNELLRDFHSLTEEYQGKTCRYIKKLLQVQRAEQHLTAEIHSIEWKRKVDKREGIHCSFCGKHQDDAERIIAGPNETYICDECARLCGSILDELKSEEGEEST